MMKKSSPVNGESVDQLHAMEDWPEDARLVVTRRGDDFIILSGRVEMAGDPVAVLSKENAIRCVKELSGKQDQQGSLSVRQHQRIACHNDRSWRDQYVETGRSRQ